MLECLRRIVRALRATGFLWALVGLATPVAWAAEAPKHIVLIGGPKSHGVGEHDFANGVAVLQELVSRAPAASNLEVVAFPDGWPAAPNAFDNAATIVLYFDGAQVRAEDHPLADAAHRNQFEQLMGRGVGVVALHQASTVGPHDTTINLQRWLGGARFGTFDRTEETVWFEPIRHPITRGVGSFELTDEFYPTINFVAGLPKPTPLLVAKLHPQFRQGKALVIDRPETRSVAWVYERQDGGRAFTFTGLHFLIGLDNPNLRTLVLNAILWTAKQDVPTAGVSTAAAADVARKIVERERELTANKPKTITEAIVIPAAKAQVLAQPWGQLTWYVGRSLNNSDNMTVGQAIIDPGKENPRHYHPNCDEVLHVVKGHILNSMGDKSVEMFEGDTINIPSGVHHNARNLGPEPAILSISYNSADRVAIGE